MKFKLEIEIDNAAFLDGPGWEVGRILGDAAERVRDGARQGYLWDYNGNRVGEFSTVED